MLDYYKSAEEWLLTTRANMIRGDYVPNTLDLYGHAIPDYDRQIPNKVEASSSAMVNTMTSRSVAIFNSTPFPPFLPRAGGGSAFFSPFVI